MSSKIKILPIGSYLDLDNDGYIVNSSNLKSLPSKWNDAVDEIIQDYSTNIGESTIESIVIRGSVAQGKPTDHLSDLDTITIVHSAKNVSKEWISEAEKRLQEKFPFIAGFEFVIWDYDRVINPNSINMRFLLKTQSITVFGKDLIAGIEKFKPDKNLAKSLLSQFDKSLEDAKIKLESKVDTAEIEDLCRWISKRIIRAGFYLAMPKAHTFTKDLYPAVQTFSTYYPEKEDDMNQALEYAINPISDKQKLLDYLNDFGDWVSAEINTQYL